MIKERVSNSVFFQLHIMQYKLAWYDQRTAAYILYTIQLAWYVERTCM